MQRNLRTDARLMPIVDETLPDALAENSFPFRNGQSRRMNSGDVRQNDDRGFMPAKDDKVPARTVGTATYVLGRFKPVPRFKIVFIRLRCAAVPRRHRALIPGARCRQCTMLSPLGSIHYTDWSLNQDDLRQSLPYPYADAAQLS
ncbi:hypothetical protein [Noviherbaspirillum sp.]|uniref:hypothetical protein n=1 Tax=Noviherbaspirillum sp. TaxID=1926288 RepID=UPI002FE0AE23